MFSAETCIVKVLLTPILYGVKKFESVIKGGYKTASEVSEVIGVRLTNFSIFCNVRFSCSSISKLTKKMSSLISKPL